MLQYHVKFYRIAAMVPEHQCVALVLFVVLYFLACEKARGEGDDHKAGDYYTKR